jgi:hypothetical protein
VDAAIPIQHCNTDTNIHANHPVERRRKKKDKKREG